LVERPGVEQARERVLTAEELRWIWPAFEKLGYPFGPFFKLALLTGQRRDEVGGMEWREIDEENSDYNKEKMEGGAKSTSVLGVSQSQQGGVSLDTMVQRLVQKSVWEIDSKYK
jgi:integrase